MTELPAGWTSVPLKDLVEATRPRVNPKEADGLSFIGMDHVEPQTMRLLGTVPASTMKSAAVRFEPGDVIYGRLRPYLNKVYRPSFRGLGSAEFIVLTPSERLDGEYLRYLLNSADFVRFATGLNTGDRPRVDFKQIGAYTVPLPDLDEQRRIVGIIEERLALLDAAEAALRKARLRLDVYLRRRMEVLVDHQGDRQWPTVALGEIASIGTGSTPLRTRTDYWADGAVPWVTSGQLNDDFVTVPAAHVTDVAVVESRLKLWPRHTLLVAMYGEGRTRGKCSELLIEATTNQACAAILLKADAPIRREFLKLLLQSRYQSHRKMASGGVQPNLNLSIVRGWRIPIPSFDEQDEIAQEMAASSSVLAEVQQTVKASIVRAVVLRRRVVSAEIPASAAS